MSALDEVVGRILSLRPDLTNDKVRKLIRQKRREVGGLLSKEGAAYMVAADLGISLPGKLNTKVRVSDLVAGIDDATVTGRALSAHPARTFTRSDGSEGNVARVVIADKTGTIDVVLWDDKAKIVSQIGQGQIVRVSHGYVRTGLDGRPELNVGSKGEVIISPIDAEPDDYPEVKEFLKKIGELKEEDVNVNLVGIATRVSPTSTFKRPDGRTGKVMRVRLADETGRIRAVFWNEKVDEGREIRRGDCIRVMGARVKRGLRGGLELHVGGRCRINVVTEKPPGIKTPPVTFTKIGELKLGMSDADVLARVTHVGPTKEFKRHSGKVGRVADLNLKDDTGSVRLAVWNDQADIVETVSVGDVVLIEGAYTREGLRGVDLNLGKWGAMTVNPDVPEAKLLPPATEGTTPIDKLKTGSGNVSIEGIVPEEPTITDVVTRSGQPVRVASLRVRDQTGEVRVSLWRDLADKVEGLSAGTRIRVVNAYVKTGLNGSLELSSGYLTTINVMSKPVTAPENRKTITEEEKLDAGD